MNWISVKDRLPTEEENINNEFIVTVEIAICGSASRYVHWGARYDEYGWYCYNSEYEITTPIKQVIAWAFPPEPYQGE